MSDGLQFQ